MPSMRAMMLIAGVSAAAVGLAGNPGFAGNAGLADDSPDIAFAKRMFAASAPKPKGYACFVRRYDAAHMAQHPLQKVTVMKLLITAEMVPDDKVLEYSFRLGVNFRDRAGDFDSSGDCGHAAVTKVPDSAETAIPAGVDISCGVDCDGGGVTVSLANNDPDRQADRPHPHLERQEPRRVGRHRAERRRRRQGVPARPDQTGRMHAAGRRPQGTGRDAAQMTDAAGYD